MFLGVTLGCARCHNHKYDPFTQKEFYQVFAYFNNVPELGRAMKYGNSPPLIPAPTADQQASLAVLESQIRKVEDALPRTEPKWEAPSDTASCSVVPATMRNQPGLGSHDRKTR